AEDAARPGGRRRREPPDRLAAARGVQLDREHACTARRIGAAPERMPPAAEVEDDAFAERARERLQPVDELDPALDRIAERRHRSGLCVLDAEADRDGNAALDR